MTIDGLGLGLWCLMPLSICMKVALNTITLTPINVDVFSGEATKTNFIVLGLIRQELNLTIFFKDVI